MLRTKDIMSCLPLLACILGKQYNITVEIGGTTAYTNGKTIHIPSLKIDTDEMYINMTRGYVDHEAAHIRYTDFQLLQKANLTRLQFHLFNIIEDWRVETLLGKHFPGCRKNFDFIIVYLFGKERQKAGSNAPAFFVLEYILLTIRSWNSSEVEKNRTLSRKEMVTACLGIEKELDACLKKIHANTRTTQDAIAHALLLESIIKKWIPEQPQGSTSQMEKRNDHLDGEQSVISEEKEGAQDAYEDSFPKTMGAVLREKLSAQAEGMDSEHWTVAKIRPVTPDVIPPDMLRRTELITRGLSIRIQGSRSPCRLPILPQRGGLILQSCTESKRKIRKYSSNGRSASPSIRVSTFYWTLPPACTANLWNSRRHPAMPLRRPVQPSRGSILP